MANKRVYKWIKFMLDLKDEGREDIEIDEIIDALNNGPKEVISAEELVELKENYQDEIDRLKRKLKKTSLLL